MASLMLILYQSTDAENPSKNVGVNTKPAVQVSAFSGARSGLPPEKLAPDCVVGWPLVSTYGLFTVTPPRVVSNRSSSEAARTSRERVARRRRLSMSAQSK